MHAAAATVDCALRRLAGSPLSGARMPDPRISCRSCAAASSACNASSTESEGSKAEAADALRASERAISEANRRLFQLWPSAARRQSRH